MKYLIEEEYSEVPRDDGQDGTRLQEAKKQQIWAVGGGKGGVGKSLITANTAIAMARLGYRVVAVDLDLGGANLHTCLGVDIPEYTLGDFVNGRAKAVDQVVVKTPIKKPLYDQWRSGCRWNCKYPQY